MKHMVEEVVLKNGARGLLIDVLYKPYRRKVDDCYGKTEERYCGKWNHVCIGN